MSRPGLLAGPEPWPRAPAKSGLPAPRLRRALAAHQGSTGETLPEWRRRPCPAGLQEAFDPASCTARARLPPSPEDRVPAPPHAAALPLREEGRLNRWPPDEP